MKNRGWLVLVRAAELVARHGITVQVDRLFGAASARRLGSIATSETNGWRLTIITDDESDIDAPISDDETEQLAELTANRWFERMKSAERSSPPPSHECESCGAAGGEDCTPMHPGERDPGGWSHPIRLIDPSGKESEVVRWARRVDAGDLSEALPGVPLAGSWMEERADDGMYPELRAGVTKIVDELLALAYINECALLSTRKEMLAERIADREIAATVASNRCVAMVTDEDLANWQCSLPVGHDGLHRVHLVGADGLQTIEWSGTPVIQRAD